MDGQKDVGLTVAQRMDATPMESVGAGLRDRASADGLSKDVSADGMSMYVRSWTYVFSPLTV